MKAQFDKVFRYLMHLIWILLIFMLACSGTPPEDSSNIEIEQDPSAEEIVREEPVQVEAVQEPDYLDNQEPIIPETTVILSESVAPGIASTITLEGPILIFSQSALAEAGYADFSLDIDDVLVVDPIEGAPNGLLRRVVGVSDDGSGNLLVDTVPASLTQAIQTGEVHHSYEGEVLSYTSNGYGGHLAKMRSAPLQGIPISIDLDGVKIVGSAEIKPSFQLDIVIDDYQLKSLNFVDTSTVTGRLEVISQIVNESFKPEPLLLKSFPLSPYAVIVEKTDLNLWITPTVNVYIGAEGRISAKISAAVEQDVNLFTRLFYPDQNGEFAWEFAPVLGDFRYEPPTFSANSNLLAYIRPELVLQVFEFGGPYTGLDAFLELDVDPLRSPIWELYGGVRGDVGIEIEFLTFTLADWRYEYLYEKWLIDNGGVSAPVETQPVLPSITETPTATHFPTATQVPTLTPERAIPPPSGNANIYMIYDDVSATVINSFSEPISLLDVVFRQVSNEGDTTAEFPTFYWGHAYSEKPITSLPSGDCFVVSSGNFSRPTECASVWSWFTSSSERFYFWRPIPGSDEFQVLRDDQVIHTCSIPDRACSFYLPQP